jgi:hypothetical protein
MKRMAAMAARHKAAANLVVGRRDHSATTANCGPKRTLANETFRPARVGEFTELYHHAGVTGRTLYSVAKAAGINPKNIYKWARSHGKPSKPDPTAAAVNVVFIN